MRLRNYTADKDFDVIKNWITEPRAHAMWCANIFSYPLSKDNMNEKLEYAASQFGDAPFIAETDDGEAVGFFCYNTNTETKEGMLKFVVLNPDFRGTGAAGEMLNLVKDYAFNEAGAEALHLNVFPENPRAKRCYEKAGFVERNLTENAFEYEGELWGRLNMIIRKN